MPMTGIDEMVESTIAALLRLELSPATSGDPAVDAAALAEPAQPESASTAAEATIAIVCRILTDRLMFI